MKIMNSQQWSFYNNRNRNMTFDPTPIGSNRAPYSEVFQYSITGTNLYLDNIRNKLVQYGITNVQINSIGDISTLSVSVHNPTEIQMQGIRDVLMSHNKFLTPVSFSIPDTFQLPMHKQSSPSSPPDPLPTRFN